MERRETDLRATARYRETGEGLSELHQRLEAHFCALRASRDKAAGPGFPIFGLEHGLPEGELTLLARTVQATVERRQLTSASYLPVIVYATEVGYDYTGEEYWQTFSARTPGWAQLDDREYIRWGFQEFARRFGGARPSGAWAKHFSIICWPITHAVLPLDLQHQFARLLFDYRSALTSAVLADPAELGLWVAARAWSFSPRFQNLAQNTELLGQIASALLVGEGEQSPYLLDTTLARIADSLTAHREARMWLRAARSSASHIRTRGFRSPGTPAVAGGEVPDRTADEVPGRPRLPAATDPTAFLRLTGNGWEACLRLPNLSVLAERLPGLHEHLGRFRVVVAGTAGAPLARRKLLVPGQEVALAEWPDRRVPLLQFEGSGTEKANGLLADQCVLSPGPPWLFRVQEPGFAAEVRGKFVRPGRCYVLLGPAAGACGDMPTWMTRTTSATAGVTAYDVRVPAVISDSDVKHIRSLGLSVVSDVVLRPAGIVPSEWDGEGAAGWLAGEDASVAIGSNHAVTKCAITIDGEQPAFLNWPGNDAEFYVALRGLAVGEHDVRVALFPADNDLPLVEGNLLVSVLTAQPRPSAGTIREGLLLVANPAQPALGELWDGRAAVELLGPASTQVTMTAALERGNGTRLASSRFRVRVPVGSAQWQEIMAREIRGCVAFQDHYDEAEVLVLAAAHPQLGAAQLRCDREFVPLRWIVSKDRNGDYARLIDNTESRSVKIIRYSFAAPAVAESIALSPEAPVRWPAGGLLLARASDFESSVIVPPRVQRPADLQRKPQLASSPATARTILDAVALSALWASASLPGNPFARYERQGVLRAITSRLASSVSGARWSQLEERGAAEDEYSFLRLQEGVGKETYQRKLAATIRQQILKWEELAPQGRAEEFAVALSTFGYWTRVGRAEWPFAEFLLRLASEPATITGWPEKTLLAAAERVILSPVLMRAARFAVLAIHLDEADDTGTVYRGWSWT